MTSRFIKRLFVAFLCISLLWTPLAAQEVLEDFSAKNTSAANDELRKLRNNVRSINDAAIYVPVGGIIMWSGSIATIPSGWALCDGTNGTPNLIDKFIVCAKEDDSGTAKTNLTGSLTQSGGSIAHNHTATDAGHTHTITLTNQKNDASSNLVGQCLTSPTVSGTASITVASKDAPQPYYALAFIMKL